jgi:hypothetical protein
VIEPSKSKLIVLVTHSLGELDVVLPILLEKKNKKKTKIEIIFTVKKIYNVFIESDFYNYVCREYNFRVSFFHFQNKFDNSKKGRLSKYLFRYLMLIKSLPNFFIIFFKVLRSDIIFHEFTHANFSVKIVYFINHFIRKNIYTYCHGASLHPNSRGKIFKDSKKSKYLLFHEMNKENALSLGYKNFIRIGLPQFYPNWKNTINNYIQIHKNNFEVAYVALFTRGINEYYMNEKQYRYLFLEAVKAVREVYSNILIIIKPHPREDTEFLKKLIKEEKIQNIKITSLHASPLVKMSELSISLFTSCILDCLSMQVPAVEFYKHSQKFLDINPDGSVFKNIGFESCDTKALLIKKITNIKKKNFLYPIKLMNNLYYPDINSLNEIFD